jgi:hypothetical protein
LSASSIPSYPLELLFNGRLPDETFAPDEPLFYRAKEVDKGGKIGSVDVMCPNTSFNRGKYSKPVHVLYAKLPQFLKWHVMEMRVDEVPPELQHPDGRKFQFTVVHDPVKPPVEPDENYAHSEIRAFHNKQQSKRLPGLVEKQIRQMLADRMQEVPAERLNP